LKKVVRTIESTETTDRDKPKQDVTIVDCGILPVEQPYAVEKVPSDENI
jgi:hypothetical protein